MFVAFPIAEVSFTNDVQVTTAFAVGLFVKVIQCEIHGRSPPT